VNPRSFFFVVVEGDRRNSRPSTSLRPYRASDDSVEIDSDATAAVFPLAIEPFPFPVEPLTGGRRNAAEQLRLLSFLT
jgi:hypothetical protein